MRFCQAVAALIGAALVSGGSFAQDYPSKPVRIIVPSSAGGPLDITARGLGQKLSGVFAQPVIIENRAGANGVIGTNAVAKSAADGYTLLIATASHTTNPSTVRDLPYDALADFTPISEIARTYGLVLVSGMDFPARSVPELLGLAKGRAAKLTYATSGYGNPTHVAGAFFGRLSGIPLQDVQYKGSSASNMQDLVTGRVDLAFLALINIASHIRAGKVRAFALTGSRRSPLIPDVPTFQDLGYKDMELIGVYGLHFRAKVRRERVQRMHQEVAKALRTPEVTKMFNESGMYATGTPPEEFAAYVKADIPRQARLMKELGLKPQ